MFMYGQLSLKLRCVHLSVCRRCHDVAGLGAMHVNELCIADWSSVPSFVFEGDGEEMFVDGSGPIPRQHELMLLLPEVLKPQCPTPSTTTHCPRRFLHEHEEA